METGLAKLSEARRMLAECRTIEDVLDVRDVAAAVLHWTKAINESLEAQNYAAEIKLRAERKAGEMLAKMENRGRPKKGDVASPLSDYGITRKQSSRWQQEASVDDDMFAEWVAKCNDEQQEVTQAGLLRLASGRTTVAAAANTGEIEWYTPAEYIAMARQVMGSIDLDPASSRLANEVVEATAFYTADECGLEQEWHGNVWLNPPYASTLVQQFTQKLTDECVAGNVKQAILLVNNATDTQWFRNTVSRAAMVCFKTGRIAFIGKEGKPVSGTAQGQVFMYFGRRAAKFAKTFSAIGWVAEVKQ